MIPRLAPLARTRASRRPYSVLLPVGFAVPLALPQARCALTAPFHPYRSCLPKRDAASGGLFSVALSLGLTPAGRYPAPYVHGARTFLSGHLSALTRATVQPTDTLGMGCRRTHVKPAPERCPSYARGHGHAEPRLLALGWASRAAMRSLSVARVDSSMLPSTPCGRKWRWNAAMASRVAPSR